MTITIELVAPAPWIPVAWCLITLLTFAVIYRAVRTSWVGHAGAGAFMVVDTTIALVLGIYGPAEALLSFGMTLVVGAVVDFVRSSREGD